MGCNQSRKEYSFSDEEIKKLRNLFTKTANSYSETKDKNELNVQAFRDLFEENKFLGERLHEFMLKNSSSDKVDADIFVDVIELILRKPSNKDLGDVYLKHDKIGLLCAILFPHMRKGLKQKDENDGLDLVLCVLHMLNGQHDQKVNDGLARTIIDRVFPTNDAKLEFWSFNMLIKEQINLIGSLIHIYFKNKFLDGTVSFLLPKMPEQSSQVLVQKDQLTQLYLNNQYLLNSSQFKLLYQAGQDNYNFDQLASQLQSFTGETFILLQFRDDQQNVYVVGGFNPSKWGQLNSDSLECYIFSLSPKYRQYQPIIDNAYPRSQFNQFCFLSTSEQSGREPGLGFGQYREDCRLWVDGKSLNKSVVRNTEKHFKKGSLIPPNAVNPVCTLIEVYGVHSDQSRRNFSYSTINNMQLNQILAGSRDLRNSLTMNLDSTRQSNVGVKSTYQNTNNYTTSTLYRTDNTDDVVKRSAAPKTDNTYTPVTYTSTSYQTYQSPQTTTYTTTSTNNNNNAGQIPEYKKYYLGDQNSYPYTGSGEVGRYSSTQQPGQTTYTYTTSERKTTTN